MVRVLPDVGAIDREFDYLAAGDDAGRVAVGTLVRVELNGRRVGGWVTAVDVEPPAGVALRPLAKVSGLGPPASVVDLCRWTALQWAGPLASLLGTASPPTMVRSLPSSPGRTPPVARGAGRHLHEIDAAFAGGVGVLRLPPAADTFDVVLAAAGRGSAVVLAPSLDGARAVAGRLRRAGVDVALLPRDWARAAAGGVVAVGSRAAAFAPLPATEAVVVLDEHDQVYQEERAPTWHARDVVVERARRQGAPAVLVSPCPSLEALQAGRLVTVGRAAERAGWALLDVVDLRREDPRTGLLTDRLVALLRGDRRVVCVLNRKGRARLLACGACRAVARCEACDGAVALDDEALVCGRCAARRPVVCQDCGSQRLKVLRPGVRRLADELTALLGEAVAEVTGDEPADEVDRWPRVVIGTEAALHRAPAADAVAFLDFDHELLAPRYRAGEEALALLARASRLVGGRSGGGRVVVQTRLAGHEVLDAALHANPERVVPAEVERRRSLGFPPFAAVAEVSGAAAGDYVAQLGSLALDGATVEVLGPTDGRWLLRAPDRATLAAALARLTRPPGRLRVAVDPLRL